MKKFIVLFLFLSSFNISFCAESKDGKDLPIAKAATAKAAHARLLRQSQRHSADETEASAAPRCIVCLARIGRN